MERIVDSILLNGPDALKACKALMRRVAGDVAPDLRRDAAGRIANIRASREGREGASAFLEKRKPDWQQQSHELFEMTAPVLLTNTHTSRSKTRRVGQAIESTCRT